MRLDAHVHVFHDRLGLRAERRYAPTYSALPEDLLAHLDRQNMFGAVLVQPSFLADHGFALEAAAEHSDRLRVVAAPASLAELRNEWTHWQECGVAGIRLNLVGKDIPDLGSPDWLAVGRDLADAAMHLEIQASGSQWEQLSPDLPEWPSDVVIDHLGRSTDWKELLRLGQHEHVWFKASAPYRWPDRIGAEQFVRSMLETTGGERILWGSDWPFTQHENETSYLEMLEEFQVRLPDVAGISDANLQRLLGPRRFPLR